MRQALPELPVRLRRAQWTGAGQLLGTSHRGSRDLPALGELGRRPASRDSFPPLGPAKTASEQRAVGAGLGQGLVWAEEQPMHYGALR